MKGFVDRCLAGGALLALSACQDPPPQSDPALVQAAPIVAPAPPPVDPCDERIRELYKLERLPGAPGFEKRRVELLGRARSAPVVFMRTPAAEHASDEVKKLRRQLEVARDPTSEILRVLRRSSRRLDLRREVFQQEGYLYAEQPLLALRMSQILRLDHLHDEEDVLIERGRRTLRARRHKGRYYLVPEGTEPGARPEPRKWKEASILLLDRTRAAESPSLPRLAMDLEPLREELGFDSARVERITPAAVVLSLRTGPVDSTIVGRFDGTGEVSLECERVSPGSQEALVAARAESLDGKKLIEPVLAAAHDIVARRLPFDEPRTEEGQQDGQLRVAFREAYPRYKEIYEFNGDEYYVFDGHGRPRLPQVCIDFITDAFDWGTGGHWPKRGEKRRYVRGALNFASFDIENARSVEQIALFASDLPQWFDMHWLEDPDRVKFYKRREFFEALTRTAERYKKGDVVFIYGLRDDDKFHYHSFFIDELDPLTGAPILLAANAGPAQVRSWEGEMSNAPKRRIVARLRVRPEVLRQAYAQAKASPGVPLEHPPRPEPEGQESDAGADATSEAQEAKNTSG